MELTPAGISAGATLVSCIAGIAGVAIRGAFADRDARIAAVKATQLILFSKLDENAAALNAHRLHAAETYVNREMLREALAPINKSLEEIKDDLREERHSK